MTNYINIIVFTSFQIELGGGEISLHYVVERTAHTILSNSQSEESIFSTANQVIDENGCYKLIQ